MILTLLLLLAPAQPAAPPLDEVLSRALEHLDAADHSAARRAALRALELYPESPVVYNVLGVVEADGGSYEAAERRFREAIARAPRYTDAYLNLGRLYQEGGGRDPDAATKALAAYQAVLGYEPGHAAARFQSAALHQALGEFGRSLEDLNRLPAADRDRPAALAVRCADHAGLGERAEADAAARALLARPDLGELDVRPILPVLAAHDRADLVLRMLALLRERGWASPEDLRRLGALHEGAGQLALAREVLEEAALHHPGDAGLLLDLARVAHQQADHEGALGYLGHARVLAPGDARVHFFFGMVCVAMDLGAEAYNSLLEAYRLDPDNASVAYALGAVALHRRDPAEAIPYFRRYSELKPEDPRGGFGVGIAAFRAGSYEAARAELIPAAERAETAAAANYFLARIAREEGDLDEALRLVRRSIGADPDYPDPYSELGFVHMRRREHERAEQALERCLELDEDHYLGTLYLAMLYGRTGDPRQAELEARFDELEQRRMKSFDSIRPIDVRPY